MEFANGKKLKGNLTNISTVPKGEQAGKGERGLGIGETLVKASISVWELD